jgi:hypothetical protein
MVEEEFEVFEEPTHSVVRRVEVLSTESGFVSVCGGGVSVQSQLVSLESQLGRVESQQGWKEVVDVEGKSHLSQLFQQNFFGC